MQGITNMEPLLILPTKLYIPPSRPETVIRQLNTPVAWFSISEGDNEALIFFSYLISALQTIDPGIGESILPMLQSPQSDYRLVLTNLIQDLDQRDVEMVLVLDDYRMAPQ